MERNTGKTTEQLRTAPKNALFFWCTGATHYARSLAAHLGRTDITIAPIDNIDYKLDEPGWVGNRYIIVDHAAQGINVRYNWERIWDKVSTYNRRFTPTNVS